MYKSHFKIRVLLLLIVILIVGLFNNVFAQFPNLPSGVQTMGKGMTIGTPNKTNNVRDNFSLNKFKKKTTKVDSLKISFPDSLLSKESELETTVQTFSSDSTVLDVPTKVYQLFGNAEVIYGDIKLKADYIKLDWDKNTVFAHGMPDTTKAGAKVKGKPVFYDHNESYNSDTIKYNFKSKKAIVSNIITQQGDGYVGGLKVKKDPENNMYLADAKYTTCNLAEPHFHIKANKIKLVDKKSLVSGPFHFVLADIPLPIGLPFGIFPIPKKKEIGTSGFIMGTYGEEPTNRGFYFRDFGYYHAFNEYIGAKLLAQVYTNGSYGGTFQTEYTKKYKYAGQVNVQFNHNLIGSIVNPIKSNDYTIAWSHSPKSLRTDRSFSTNVNYVSPNFTTNNRRTDNVNQYTNNGFNSGINFTRNFGPIIRTSTGISIDQNLSTKVVNSRANFTFGLNQFNPFVPVKKQTGRWFESFRVGLDVNSSVTISNIINNRNTTYTDFNMAGVYNKPVTTNEQRQIAYLQSQLYNQNLTAAQLSAIEAELRNLLYPTVDLKEAISKRVSNTSYSVPISLPNIKISRFLNLTPSVSYRGDYYAKQLKYKFIDPSFTGTNLAYSKANGKTVTAIFDNNLPADSVRMSYDKNGNLTETLSSRSGGLVVADTLNEPGFAHNVSFGVGANTRIYGIYRFKGDKKIQAIRHTISPSMSISYTPNNENNGYATKTQIRSILPGSDDAYNYKYLAKFINGSASNPNESANVSFGITNQIEAKIRNGSDTAAKAFEKINLLDNLGINTSYNPLAKPENQQNKWSNVNISANSTLLKGLININGNTTLDLYSYEKDKIVASNLAGNRSYDSFKWQKNYDGKNELIKYKGNWFPQYNFSISTRLTPKTFNKKLAEKEKQTDPIKIAAEKFVAANPMEYVDFSIPWSLNIVLQYNYSKQGFAESRVTSTVQLNGDFSLTPKWKFTYSTGWDFRYKSYTNPTPTNGVTLTSFGIIRELHCWDMSFNWTPIAGNAAMASNYSFTLKPRSALLQDLKLSRRRQYYDRGGY